MAFKTEYNSAKSSSSCVKDIYVTNIAVINRNEPGKWKRYDRKETEEALRTHFYELLQTEGKVYGKIMKVNIPALISQHCNTYIAFMRLEIPNTKRK